MKRTTPPRLSRRALAELRAENDADLHGVRRPRTRAECREGVRPCPWVGCRHSMYLDITPTGSITLNFPELEPWEMEESCCLDIAERGEMPLHEVARKMNVTAEWARQIEIRALITLASNGRSA